MSVEDRFWRKIAEKANKQQKKLLLLHLNWRRNKISKKEFQEKSKAFSIDVIESVNILLEETKIEAIIEAIEELQKRVSKIESKMKL